MTVKECIKYVYEPKDKDERKNRICQLIAEWLTENATENKMAFVAAMFGKKLGEEFKIRTQDIPKITVSIRENGVFTKDGKRTIWVLERLLMGEIEIVEDE